MFACLECGKKFNSAVDASRTIARGCPKCGGTDIDLAPVKKDHIPAAAKKNVSPGVARFS